MSDTEKPVVETPEKPAVSSFEADLTKYKVLMRSDQGSTHTIKKSNRPTDSRRHRSSGHEEAHRALRGGRKSDRSLHRG